jgi:hypothetical protein
MSTSFNVRNKNLMPTFSLGSSSMLGWLRRSVLARGRTSAVFELFGKTAGIHKAAFARNLGGGEARFA